MIDKKLDPGKMFPGGNGMFIQYEDVVKPIYLTLINKFLINNYYPISLPYSLLKNFSQASLAEWYINRKHINPLKELDLYKQYSEDELDKILSDEMDNDNTIYDLSPIMKIHKILLSYAELRMDCPIYIYSKNYHKGIEDDIQTCFRGVVPLYVHGDLEKCLQKLDFNFTYIFSDINLAAKAAELLVGATSHILVLDEYRYNYNDNFKTMKYNLQELMKKYPVCRIERFLGVDRYEMSLSLSENMRRYAYDSIEEFTKGEY